MSVFDKVYTCDLVVIGSGELKQASITCSFSFLASTTYALRCMRQFLDDDNLQDHKMTNIRRLK